MPDEPSSRDDDYTRRVLRRRDRESSIVGLHREVTRQEQQIRSIYDWLKNKDESDQQRFKQLTESLTHLSTEIRQRDSTAGAPLWRFASVLIGLGTVGASIIIATGGLVVSGINEKVSYIHTQVIDNKQAYDEDMTRMNFELVKSVEQRSRLDEMAKSSKESLTKTDEVLQREIDLKDQTIREEINSRMAGIEKQFELLTLRVNEIAGRLFAVVGNTFPPMQNATPIK